MIRLCGSHSLVEIFWLTIGYWMTKTDYFEMRNFILKSSFRQNSINYKATKHDLLHTKSFELNQLGQFQVFATKRNFMLYHYEWLLVISFSPGFLEWRRCYLSIYLFGLFVPSLPRKTCFANHQSKCLLQFIFQVNFPRFMKTFTVSGIFNFVIWIFVWIIYLAMVISY